MPAAIAVPLIIGGASAAASAGASIYASKKNSSAANSAARYQTESANYAADLEAKSAERALAFAKEQEAARQKEWAETQARNKAIYDAEMARDQGRYDDLQSRLAPYRQFGAGSLGQLARPIPGVGTLGARMGG